MKRIVDTNLIFGGWLIVAPFLLGYSRGHVAALSNDIALGLLLVAGSLWVLTEGTADFGVTTFETACGAWLILAPFVFHLRATPHVLINDVAVGAMVMIVSLTDAWMRGHRPQHAR